MGELRYQGKRLDSDLPPSRDGQPGRRTEKEKEKKGFWANYGSLLIMTVSIVVLLRVVFQLALVPTASMEPTIPTDSLLISWQLPYLVADPTPRPGDVTTFWSAEMKKVLVKRVIGVPGDRITFSDGYVYRNGELLDEPYLPAQGITFGSGTDAYTVPEDCLLFLGDNRGNSNDARRWKTTYIPQSCVYAKVLLCIPLREIQIPLPNEKSLSLYLPLLDQIHGVG